MKLYSLFRALFIPCLFLISLQSRAQSAEVLEAASHYKTESAILWNHSEDLRLRFEDGRLIGHSDVRREVLLLSDAAAAQYNTDEVYHGFMHSLDGVEAATLLPNGERFKTVKATQYKTTHSEEENIFYTDAKQTRVTYSSLTRFARTRLDYSITHHDVHFLPPFYFQSYMPLRAATYTVTVPKSVKIGYKLIGLHADKVKMNTEEGRNNITYTWTASEMPRATKASDAPEVAYYIPHIVVYVKEYTAPHADAPEPVLSSVADLYHYFYPFIRDVNSAPDAEMTGIVDSLTRGISAQREKAARIYAWVQEHMRYVAYEDSFGGYIPRPAALVCSRRFGDCKDMTSVLVAMMRKAGLDAHFAWIGTRDIPYRYDDLPLPIADNHMICVLHLGDDWLFVDGTDRNIPFGNPPYHIQGKEALVSIDAQHYKVLTVPTAAAEKNIVSDSTVLLLNGTDAEGAIYARFTGYNAWRYAAIMQYSSESEKDKVLRGINRRGSDKFTQRGATTSVDGGDGRDFAITSHFTLPGYAREVDGEKYVNMNLQRDYEDDFVDKATREAPIEHSFKKHEHQVVSLRLPEGYTASYLPPDKSDGDKDLWSYKLHYEQKGREVLLVKDIVMNTLMVQPEQFAAHNRLVEGLKAQYKESVVLSRK